MLCDGQSRARRHCCVVGNSLLFDLPVIKRSAIAFSLNAIVNVRLRCRHEMTFLISETIRGSDLKIYHKVALHSLHISTGNDVIDYFRSAANCTNV